MIALRGDVDSWNPYVTEDAASAYLLDLVYPRLVRESEGRPGEPAFTPWLAESWEAAPDGRALTFRLRPDASWSDGSPVTCDDVAFTLRAQKDEAVAWAGSFVKERIASVECPGRRTAVFRFTTAYADQMLDANDDAIVPASYGEVPFSAWRDTPWHERPKTSGPFRIAAVRAGQEAVLERDPHFWDAASVLPDRVVFRVYPDSSAAVRALLAGEIDLLPGVPPQQASDVAAGGRARVAELPSLTFSYIGWNVIAPGAYEKALRAGATDDEALMARLRREAPHPVLADARVRRALTMAIDREDLVRGLWSGRATPGSTPILAPFAREPAAGLPHDPGAARRLLASAGFADTDGDGVLDRGGSRLELGVLLNADNRVRRDAFERIAAAVAPLGVRLVADAVPRAEFNERARTKRFDAILAGRVAGTRVEPQAILHGREAPRRGNNVTSWATAESDALLDRAAAAPTRDLATPLWRSWQLLYRDEQPLTILWVEKTLVGIGARVDGSPPPSFNPFIGVHRIGVRPPARP